MSIRKVARLGAISLVALALAGCSPTAQADSTANGGVLYSQGLTLKEVDTPKNWAPESSAGVILLGENTVIFESGGSSSCPRVFDSVERAGNAIKITAAGMDENRACTMDYRFTFFELKSNTPFTEERIELYNIEGAEPSVIELKLNESRD